MSTSLKYEIVTTKKTHECFACCRKFPEGSKMRYFVGIVGEFSYGYSCLTCDEIMHMMDYDDDGFPYAFVADELEKGQTPEQLLEILKKK